MSVIATDPDPEDDYGLKRRKVSESTGLCIYCKEDAAEPERDLCSSCRAEIELELTDEA